MEDRQQGDNDLPLSMILALPGVHIAGIACSVLDEHGRAFGTLVKPGNCDNIRATYSERAARTILGTWKYQRSLKLYICLTHTFIHKYLAVLIVDSGEHGMGGA